MSTPASIGPYRVVRALGTGGFATVWLATDAHLGAEVAIKVLADNWSLDPDVRNRFLEEARLLWSADHPRLVRVVFVGELEDGRPYFVMRVADRGTLGDRIRSRFATGGFTLPEALTLAVEAAGCLSAVHELGVVHRDVKPNNFLFRSLPPRRPGSSRPTSPLGDEEMILGDFGLAKQLTRQSSLTIAGGTPDYMAPEQARWGAAVDERADLFSLAAVTYQLVTGRVPFPGAAGAVGSGLSRPAPTPPSTWRAEVPPELDAAILRSLSEDPDARHPSAEAFAADLQAVLQRLAERPAPRPGPPAGAPVPPPLPRAGATDPAPPPPPVPAAAAAGTEASAARGLLLAALAGAPHSAASVEWIDAARRRLAGPAVLAAQGDALGRLGEHLPAAGVVAADPQRFGADVAVTPVRSPDDLERARRDARRWPVRPVAVLALLDGSLDPAELPTASVAGDARTLGAFVAQLVGERLADLQLTAAVALAGWAARSLAPGTATELTDALERLGLEQPVLAELDVLRDEATGVLAFPPELRDELRRVLRRATPADRLGVPAATSPAACRDLAAAAARRLRTLLATSRVPYRARDAVLVASRAYDRLSAPDGP